jgi:hypothetical protein
MFIFAPPAVVQEFGVLDPNCAETATRSVLLALDKLKDVVVPPDPDDDQEVSPKPKLGLALVAPEINNTA